MLPRSIAVRPTDKARHTVLTALGVAALCLVAVILGGTVYQAEHRAATERLLSAYRWFDQALLADERLGTAANMALLTGEPRWIERYEAAASAMDEAMRNASTLAAPDALQRFELKVHSSNERLSALDRAAFDSIRSGNRTAARTPLDESLYQYHKQVRSEATREFLDGIISEARSEYTSVQLHALVATSASVPMFVAGGVILWRRLIASLARSEGAYNEAEQQIKNLAMLDVLTGLSNRLAMRESLRHAIFRAEREKTKLALLMIDLDRFKPINDRHGHLIGDLVLKEVAARMAKVVRNGELRGRYGGDEFIAIVEYGDDGEVPRRVGRRLVEALSAPMTFDGLTVDIGASVGYAIYPTDATDEEQLMRRADTALYAVKEAGRGSVLAYNSDMEATVEARAELEQDLRQAIRSGLIAPYYQPLVELATGNICGLEVLSRWHHPTKGTIQPADFVDVAEAAGAINDMTMAVLQKACLDARALPPHLTIAINIAPRQIQDEWLAQKIMTILAKTKFPPQRLEVELTENALVDDIASAKHVISSLKAQGIKVALDDFGTGYSSLWYLSELPFDKIKIDRSFIKTLHDRAESAKIVAAIVGLGKSLGVPTIAEGVETQRDAEVLRALGCTIAQGFLYAKPVPAADLAEVVRSLSPGQSKRVA
jgi:diguanylate cyclase (GGDEF)-like protein